MVCFDLFAATPYNASAKRKSNRDKVCRHKKWRRYDIRDIEFADKAPHTRKAVATEHFFNALGVLLHELTHPYRLTPQGVGTYGSKPIYTAFIEVMAMPYASITADLAARRTNLRVDTI